MDVKPYPNGAEPRSRGGFEVPAVAELCGRPGLEASHARAPVGEPKRYVGEWILRLKWFPLPSNHYPQGKMGHVLFIVPI